MTKTLTTAMTMTKMVAIVFKEISEENYTNRTIRAVSNHGQMAS